MLFLVQSIFLIVLLGRTRPFISILICIVYKINPIKNI